MNKKRNRLRFQRHVKTLIWKSYLQRQRRWPILLLETIFAGLFFVASVFIAKPVFLTPIQTEPKPPLTTKHILGSLQDHSILGYAPNVAPYDIIMKRTADMLNTEIIAGNSENELNDVLYRRSRGTPLNSSVIWVIWKKGVNNTWKFSIKSTERARVAISPETGTLPNQHMSSGFLGVQMAVSRAILEHVSKQPPKLDLIVVTMPTSPLMQQTLVKQALTQILLCFTMALLPPILEIEALVVAESTSRFKRALRIRNVSSASIYFGWLTYAYFTALPICLLASITLILIFRWIHLLFALITVLAYKTVLIMLAFIMGMFHNKEWLACTWTMLFTLMQTFLSELLVHHKFDIESKALTFFLQVILPPVGLVHTFNEFALLQTKRDFDKENSLVFPIVSWSLMIAFYFAILMMLQRTIGYGKAIGGQVSWKSILFKKSADASKLHRIESPTGNERDRLQEVDELVAKAVSFRNVSKSIMGTVILSDVTFDMYRGEFTMMYADRVQRQMTATLEDLLTGLTFADKGSINMLGVEVKPDNECMNVPYMSGYCHSRTTLITDLTVEEHLIMYLEICLWNEPTAYIREYGQIRLGKLLKECDLREVKDKKVKCLDDYYQAQLCWAIAMLLEPRIIILNTLPSSSIYAAVVKDKIMRYKKYITIVKFCFASIKLEYADRVFLFDSKKLVFGGTPAYMFFKFGREYRIRLSFSKGSMENEAFPEILAKVEAAGAKIRANLGSLLILRMPTSPTAAVAALIKNLTENEERYGIISMNISVPDSEEVCNRAINEVKVRASSYQSVPQDVSKSALKRIAEFPVWKRRQTTCITGDLLGTFAMKYYTFYAYYKTYSMMMLTSAAISGIIIGISLSNLLLLLEKEQIDNLAIHGHLLTVEATNRNTTMVLHLDNSSIPISVANSYVLSEANSTKDEIDKIGYTALGEEESLTEYLVTRAIDAPQEFVRMFAYGMDVTMKNDTLEVKVLYSPLHYDNWAAPRSLARAFMALLRHYTGALDATIEVIDEPLALDLTKWMAYTAEPPLLIQFLLILSILHITLMPSKEHGLVRHMQCHTMNFSPVQYWLTMFFCDMILYTILVCLMTSIVISMIYLIAPSPYFKFEDFAILPLLLFIYGVGCIPQAYLFSLGHQATLNSMIFVIVTIILGETSIVAKVHYGQKWNYALHFMSLSPQFNMAYAYWKIKKVFLYNMECVIFKTKGLCSAETLHKCCEKCGVLQECFKRKSYLFNQELGVSMELAAIVTTSLMFVTALFLWEYRLVQRVCSYLVKKIYINKYAPERETIRVQKERVNVLKKLRAIRSKDVNSDMEFGEYLLAVNVMKDSVSSCKIRNVYFGMGRGQVVALSGLINHGRRRLCEILAGFTLPSEGELWAMSTWELTRHPHKYASQVALCYYRNPLPPWMTIFRALKLIAIVRGVPTPHAKSEVMNYIDALELHDVMDTVIENLDPDVRTRVHFAAAVVGAPPILVLDEFTAYQKYSVRRAMYYILGQLTRRGHAVFISSTSVESHMPMTNRLAIFVNGVIYDLDTVDRLVERYSSKGFTVVLHLKDEIDVHEMLRKYFKNFYINDISEVLVNVQILDSDLTWKKTFEILERLLAENKTTYSYIAAEIPIDYIYNWILSNEKLHAVKVHVPFGSIQRLMSTKKVVADKARIDKLIEFKHKYEMEKLDGLPWTVIFQQF